PRKVSDGDVALSNSSKYPTNNVREFQVVFVECEVRRRIHIPKTNIACLVFKVMQHQLSNASEVIDLVMGGSLHVHHSAMQVMQACDLAEFASLQRGPIRNLHHRLQEVNQ